MWEVQVIYTSGKKYTFTLEEIEKYVKKETIAKIKKGLLKEISKL